MDNGGKKTKIKSKKNVYIWCSFGFSFCQSIKNIYTFVSLLFHTLNFNTHTYSYRECVLSVQALFCVCEKCRTILITVLTFEETFECSVFHPEKNNTNWVRNGSRKWGKPHAFHNLICERWDRKRKTAERTDEQQQPKNCIINDKYGWRRLFMHAH